MWSTRLRVGLMSRMHKQPNPPSTIAVGGNRTPRFQDEDDDGVPNEALQAVVWGTQRLDLGTSSSSPSSSSSCGALNDESLGVALFVNVLLLRKLRFVHGEFVQVQAGPRRHIGRIVATFFEKTSNTPPSRETIDKVSSRVLLSPLLAFNLGLPSHAPTLEAQATTVALPRVTLTRLRASKDSSYSLSNTTRLFAAKPRLAAKAVIAPLLVSTVSCQQHAAFRQPDALLAAIRRFFGTPQLLQAGDVFGVPIQETFYPPDASSNLRNEHHQHNYQVLEIPQAFKASSSTARTDAIDDPDFCCMRPPKLPLDTRLVFFRVESIQEEASDLSDESSQRDQQQALFVSEATELLQSSPVTCSAPDEYLVKRFLVDATPSTRSHSSQEIASVPCDPHALQKLYSLLYPSQVSHTVISVLLSGPRGVGKSTLVHQVAKQLGAFVVEVAFTELTANSELLLLENLRDQMAKASALAPCVLYLSRFFSVDKDNEEADVRIGAVLTECLRSLATTTSRSDAHRSIPLVADVEDVNEIPKFVRQSFLYEMQVEAPNQAERVELLRHVTREVALDVDVDLNHVAQLTAGRTCSELCALVADAGVHALKRIDTDQHEQMLLDQLLAVVESKRVSSSLSPPTLHDATSLCLTTKDFEQAIQLQQAQSLTKTSTASIPNVKWEDIGGLEDVKEEILDVVQLPIQHPELFANGVRQRSGILLYGPPGTGKTLLAKAIATECNLNFLSVKGPELLNMYIGESEKNVRQVFAKARSCRPCILFFDELDSLAPMRGRGSDSGGVMDRVVSQLLTEIDGLQAQNGNDQVFVIGATNRPDLIESGLLRPGRFDRLLYLGICQDPQAKKKVIEALTRKFSLATDVDLDQLVAQCAANFTGADFYALCSIALSLAMKDRVAQLDQQVEQLNAQDCYSSTPMTVRSLLNNMDTRELLVPVAQKHFEQALTQVQASVSPHELAHYERLKVQYSSK